MERFPQHQVLFAWGEESDSGTWLLCWDPAVDVLSQRSPSAPVWTGAWVALLIDDYLIDLVWREVVAELLIGCLRTRAWMVNAPSLLGCL